MSIDRKFTIIATANKSHKLYTEESSVLFLAKDRALPAALRAYRKECERIGAEQPQLDAVDLLIQRVDQWQLENETKIPDVDPVLESEALAS